MKNKKTIAVVGIFIFFAFFWILKNGSAYDELNLMKSYMGSVVDYAGSKSHCLLYTAPFLLFLGYYNEQLSEVLIIRGENRSTLYGSRIKEIILFALIFTLIHFFVGAVFTTIFWGIEFLNSVNFIINNIISMIGYFLWYCMVGLVFNLLSDLLKKEMVALFVTYFLVLCMFFYPEFMEQLQVRTFWTPIVDLTYLVQNSVTEINVLGVIGCYLRSLTILFILYLVGGTVFSRKDFLSD